MGAAVRELEVSLRQVSGGGIDAHHARRTQMLQACGEMHGGPDREGVGRIVLSIDRAEDHQPRRDPDAHLQARALGKGLLRECFDHGPSAGDRLLGIAALGPRRSEVGGEPVASMMGEGAAMGRDDALAGLEEGRHEDFEVLRIHRIRVVRRILRYRN